MKVVNIMLEDKEHKRLLSQKAGRTWKASLLRGCEEFEKDDRLREEIVN